MNWGLLFAAVLHLAALVGIIVLVAIHAVAWADVKDIFGILVTAGIAGGVGIGVTPTPQTKAAPKTD